MRTETDICSDLHSELTHLNGGEIWVVTYSIQSDIFEALFGPFKDKFNFHILVDCGGVQPASVTDYKTDLKQIHNATLHAKLIFIKPNHFSNSKSLAYFLTGNIRQSLVNDENLCVKTWLDPHISSDLVKWLVRIRNKKQCKPFLLNYDINSERQNHMESKTLGAGIIKSMHQTNAKIIKMVFMAPWGCETTINRFYGEFPTVNKIDLYAGCNAERGDLQKLAWVAKVRTLDGCRINRFAQSRKTKRFIHAKSALFEGTKSAEEITFLYVGSGNLTRRGFGKAEGNLESPNIECGVLFQGSGYMARQLSNWHASRIIGGSSRWKHFPEPKQHSVTKGEDPDNGEEFAEDEKRNGFERKRIAKLITRAFQKPSRLNILKRICSNPDRNSREKRELERKLRSDCTIKDLHFCDNPNILERYEGYTRVGFHMDADIYRVYRVYIIVEIPAILPISEREEAKLLESLLDFYEVPTAKGVKGPGRKKRKKKDSDLKDKKNLNMRFPYRDLFILKETVLKKEYGEREFYQFLLKKVRIINELKNGTDKRRIPLWWETIFQKMLQEN